MDRLTNSSNDWPLAVALVAGLLASVAVAKHMPMTLTLGVVSSAALFGLVALLLRFRASGIAARSTLLLLVTLALMLSLVWLSTVVAR